MNYEIKTCPLPSSFKYMDVLKKGKPVHEKNDDFLIKHPPMPLSNRAKIFSPFDALNGFSDAVAAKDIQYEKKRELSEEDKRKLDIILISLKKLTKNRKEANDNQLIITVTYYVPCNDPENAAYRVMGIYAKKTGIIYKVDSEISRSLLVDDSWIPMEDIVDIDLH